MHILDSRYFQRVEEHSTSLFQTSYYTVPAPLSDLRSELERQNRPPMLITRNSDLPQGLLYSRSRFTYLCTISMTDINSTQEVGKKPPTCTILSSQSQGSFLSREHLTAVSHRLLLSFFLLAASSPYSHSTK